MSCLIATCELNGIDFTMKDTPKAPYSLPALWFHWLTFLLVAILVPTGIIMADRAERNVWNMITNTLFSTHKLIGFALLWIVVLRLAYRLLSGAPEPEPSLSSWQAGISRVIHWALYALLLILPLLGWLGVSMFPALEIFGLFSLPSIAQKSDLAKLVLLFHKAAAWVLLTLLALHTGAALFHYFVRKDGVFQRMLPVLGKRSYPAGR
jgi:cytochrome b561